MEPPLTAAPDEWRHLSRILFILGGDHGYFRPPWEAASTSADQLQSPETEEPPEPPLPPVGEDVSERVPTLLKHFSSVLGSRPDLSPRQERLLKAKQKAVPATLAERIDGHTGPPAKR